MKHIKKIIAALVSAALTCTSLVAMTACSDENDSLDKAYNKYIKEYEFEDEGKDVLTVAMSPDFAPMEFVDVSKKGDDQYVGFDVILAHFLAKELDMKLEIKPMSFDACLAAVQTGKADLGISGFSWTAERAEKFEISDYYVAGENENEQIIITTKENEGKWTKKEDLEGKKIGAQGGSLQELLVKENFGEDSLALYQELGVAVEALMAGKIDALAVAAGNGDAFISKNPDKLAKSGFEFFVEEKYKNYVVLVQKGNTDLLEKVNKALAKAMAADVYDSWYEACQIYSEVKTADELGYDDDGNKIKKED